MYLSELFRSFLPLRNPIGFGIADFVVLALALLLAAALIGHALLFPFWQRIAHKTAYVMTGLGALAILLRLALLGVSPAPLPSGADDFSYVLLGDTLVHGRLANPPSAFHEFFEAVFVLQQPTYSSIFPLGQGIALALGRMLLGSFWAGVLVSTAFLIALTYWMLRGWLIPPWALAGGLLAVIPFGPLSQWTNSYWGGALSGCAGCLVCGSLPRLSNGHAHRRGFYALLLGAGLGLQLLTRPFEAVLLIAAVLLYWLLVLRRLRWQASLVALGVLPLTLAALVTLLQNRSVTKSWTTLPYMLSRYQYGVPSTFTFQANAKPHRELTPEQDLDYRAQAAIHGDGRDSLFQFGDRLWFRFRYLRFFAPAALYVAALFSLPRLRERRFQWVAAFVILFLAGTNFYPYFFPHYLAAAGCLLILMAVSGLETLSKIEFRRIPTGALAAQLLLCLCAAHFFFWYGLHTSKERSLLAATVYDPWSFLNFGDPEGRRAIADQLTHSPGQQLVFVRYAPQHRFSEWIANSADIDTSRVVWARDIGVVENEKLLDHFPSRKAWLLEPDANPPRLTGYIRESSSFEPVR